MAGRGPKQPPPDTVGNVRGRIKQLKLLATQNAGVDIRGGADAARATTKHMRAIEPSLKKLQRRLARACKSGGTKAKPKAAKTKPSSGSPETGDDLLSKLDSL